MKRQSQQVLITDFFSKRSKPTTAKILTTDSSNQLKSSTIGEVTPKPAANAEEKSVELKNTAIPNANTTESTSEEGQLFQKPHINAPIKHEEPQSQVPQGKSDDANDGQEADTQVIAEFDDEQKSVSNDEPKFVSYDDPLYDWSDYCAQHNFNKEQWISSLTPEQRALLQLEINHLHISWLVFLHKELTKPYFLQLKRFLAAEFKNKTIFPSQPNIYSWSHYTPLPLAKCLILGQDPYHNYNQAHGLAFLVLEPTRPPPSLLNIYKLLSIEYPDFVSPVPKKSGNHGGGNLTPWARRGVLMLNACLTVEAHKANSHLQRGWEHFTEEIIKVVLEYHCKDGFVILAWGSPAQKRIAAFSRLIQQHHDKVEVFRSVHPSPLSASRGFFELAAFSKCNLWLDKVGRGSIDWALVPKPA